MQKYYYELKKAARSLTVRQYIYGIGRYRYNWHNALEILLVMQGTVEMSCGGKTILMEEDDLLLMDSNVGHASLAKEENSIAMVLHMEPEYLEEYYQPIKKLDFFRLYGRADKKYKRSDRTQGSHGGYDAPWKLTKSSGPDSV